MNAARQNPDGSISFRDERYRVEDRGNDFFEVVREKDRVTMGAFRLLEGMRFEAEGDHRDIVLAVAGVLASPHGPMPLQ
ncbi:MAG: hypothetical protein HUU21_19085 [Polyangiaceae bacterium]|nr:hypothetical protein [Polyangiaceae bacterium]